MTISSQIIEVLNHLCLKFGLAIDWTQENIFPYLQELAGKYIAWEMATSYAWLIGAGVLFVLAIILFIVETKCGCDGFAGIFGTALIAASIGICIAQVGDVLTCKYFPEKQIIEYVNYLIRTTKG